MWLFAAGVSVSQRTAPSAFSWAEASGLKGDAGHFGEGMEAHDFF